jgi:competence protein ComEC
MFDLRRIPVLRVLIPFFGGVVTGTVVFPAIQIGELVFFSLLVWLLVVILYVWQGRRPEPAAWLFSPLLFLLFFLTGHGSGHLSRPVDPGLPTDEWVVIRGEVTGSPQAGRYAHTFDMELQMLCSDSIIMVTNTNLKVYLSDSVMPVQGESWQFSGKLVPISNSGNPGAPDFRSIMGRRGCWYRFYVSSKPVSTISNRVVPGEVRRFTPALIRSEVSGHWDGGVEEVSLLKAVCLGDRSTLTDDMRQTYSVAGGMHLLAVSGLHVGLIWWVLQYMTRWMSILFRGEKQRVIAVITLLWFYAFVTGFSSSVCRSVTMFTFFTISRMMGQRKHSLNGILVSAFLLVLIEPVRLLDVGFQLSYAAIIGIVTLHPLSRRVVRVKNPILRWVFDATSVSLSAQLSTVPLVIFYFHQLPLYSFITSLIAVPLLSLLIAIFVFSVPFVSAGILDEFFNFLLTKLAFVMNHSMEHLSSIPGALLDGLTLDRVSLFIGLLILLLAMIALHSRSKIPIYLVLYLTAGSLVWTSLTGLRCRSSSELVITHFSGATMVIVRQGAVADHYCWYRDTASLDYMKEYRDISWSRRVYENRLYEVADTMAIRGKVSYCMPVAEGIWLLGNSYCSGLVVRENVKEHLWESVYGDSANYYSHQPEFILLSGEPKVDYRQVGSWMGKSEVVIDGSNRSWYKDRMSADWDGIYLTDRWGAYVKRW